MLLHRIHPNARSREARRDLADPYQMHATLCRAFSPADIKCPPGTVLWRVEHATDSAVSPQVLVQSQSTANWTDLMDRGWLTRFEAPVDLGATMRLGLPALEAGQQFRFRLRANPCVTRNKKRLGLLRLPEQEGWLVRQGAQHGFSLPAVASGEGMRPDVRVSQEGMLTGRQHAGNQIRIFSVVYDGVLTVEDPVRLIAAVQSGIGHGKGLGLGLLSIAPIRQL